MLITGGIRYDSKKSGKQDYRNFVTEYSMSGFVAEWPELNEARGWHGCGRTGETLVVAGGRGTSYADQNYLSTTEVLRPGSPAWVTVSSEPSRYIYWATISNIAGKLFLTDSSKGQFIFFLSFVFASLNSCSL